MEGHVHLVDTVDEAADLFSLTAAPSGVAHRHARLTSSSTGVRGAIARL